jgi:hypothetical protein
MNKKLLGGLAAIGLLMSGVANAVPCGWFGVEPSSQCQDGVTLQDSVGVLNGNSYFGSSNWQFLDRVDTQGDRSNTEFWRVTGAARGMPAGTFALANGIWNTYSKLAVALKGGGAYPVGAPAGTPATTWSLYMLVPGQNLYDWVYGATRSGVLRNIFTITLYGIEGGRVAVTEPATLGLLLVGAAGMVLVLRRRRSEVRL